jgi:hypothetical protein
MKRSFVMATTLAATSLFAAHASAQSASELARRELLTQAEAASAANDHVRAVELLERAGAVQWTPSHRYFIAREYQQVGRLVEALSASTSCEREAQADRTLRNREAIERGCHELAVSLQARVARVVLRVPADHPAGTRVTIAGQSVPEALWGVSFPVGAGSVEVVVEGPGLTTTRSTVDARAGQVTDVPVSIVREPVANATNTSAANTSAANANSNVVAPPRVETPPPPSSPSVAPWVVVGVGGAIAVTGAIVGGLHFAAVGSIEADCRASAGGVMSTPIVCREDGRNFDGRIRDAELLGTLGIVGISLGVATIGAGVAWAALSGRRESPRAAVRSVSPSIGRGSVGLSVGGQF